MPVFPVRRDAARSENTYIERPLHRERRERRELPRITPGGVEARLCVGSIRAGGEADCGDEPALARATQWWVSLPRERSSGGRVGRAVEQKATVGAEAVGAARGNDGAAA